MATDKPVPHRFSVDDFHRMGDTGILGTEDRVELVDGEIVEAAPIGSEHDTTTRRLAAVLSAAVGDRATVRERRPLALGGLSEPEADLCVVRPRAGDDADGLPRPEDVLLVVEVCDTSVGFDDEVKAPIYARAGVIETWIVDRAAGVVVVARDPQPCGYLDKRRATPTETVTPLMLPGVAVAVSDLV